MCIDRFGGVWVVGSESARRVVVSGSEREFGGFGFSHEELGPSSLA